MNNAGEPGRKAWEDYVRRRREQEVEDLRHHWGSAYLIVERHGILRATRRDDGASVTSLSAERLREEIRADYRVRPVPREADWRTVGVGDRVFGPGTGSSVD